MYFVQTPLQVIAIRVPDRIGKGIRGAPRDALIAESVKKENLGKAFGFHRALDSLGAILGSFLGFALLIAIVGSSSDIYRYDICDVSITSVSLGDYRSSVHKRSKTNC